MCWNRVKRPGDTNQCHCFNFVSVHSNFCTDANFKVNRNAYLQKLFVWDLTLRTCELTQNGVVHEVTYTSGVHPFYFLQRRSFNQNRNSADRNCSYGLDCETFRRMACYLYIYVSCSVICTVFTSYCRTQEQYQHYWITPKRYV